LFLFVWDIEISIFHEIKQSTGDKVLVIFKLILHKLYFWCVYLLILLLQEFSSLIAWCTLAECITYSILMDTVGCEIIGVLTESIVAWVAHSFCILSSVSVWTIGYWFLNLTLSLLSTFRNRECISLTL